MADIQSYIQEAVEHISCAVVEKQEQLILNTIQQIGGEQYQTITIDRDKVRDALQKATKTPVVKVLYYCQCPTCGRAVSGVRYCSHCGQALDWS